MKGHGEIDPWNGCHGSPNLLFAHFAFIHVLPDAHTITVTSTVTAVAPQIEIMYIPEHSSSYWIVHHQGHTM